MRARRRYVDISELPEVSRLVDSVRDDQVPHVLQRDGEEVAVLMPVHPRRAGPRMTQADHEAFLASAGGWKDVDTDRLLEDIYEHRRLSVRPLLDV
jgi:hypothetical protein